jgi:hypothetical protein
MQAISVDVLASRPPDLRTGRRLTHSLRRSWSCELERIRIHGGRIYPPCLSYAMPSPAEIGLGIALSVKVNGHHLQAIANPENGYTKVVDAGISVWGIFIVNRIRGPGENYPWECNMLKLGDRRRNATTGAPTFGLELEIRYTSCARHEFSVDVVLATSSCDQMAILRGDGMKIHPVSRH